MASGPNNRRIVVDFTPVAIRTRLGSFDPQEVILEKGRDSKHSAHLLHTTHRRPGCSHRSIPINVRTSGRSANSADRASHYGDSSGPARSADTAETAQSPRTNKEAWPQMLTRR